jgi:exoribonuclease R
VPPGRPQSRTKTARCGDKRVDDSGQPKVEIITAAISVRHYGWITAPMRRTVDVVNQSLWRALAANDTVRARRILAALPAITAQHEHVQKALDFGAREIEWRHIARELRPFEGQSLDGVVRHIGLEGVEIALTSPSQNVLVPMKWIAKRMGATPKPSARGDAIEVDGRTVLAMAQPIQARVDRADPGQRKVYLDLAELDQGDGRG